MNRNMTMMPGKRVQIITPDSESASPSKMAKRSATMGGKKRIKP